MAAIPKTCAVCRRVLRRGEDCPACSPITFVPGGSRWLGDRDSAGAPSVPAAMPGPHVDVDDRDDDTPEGLISAGATSAAHASEDRGERAPTKEAQVQRYEYQGKSLTVAELAEIAGTSASNMRQRLRRGWDVDSAVRGDKPERKSSGRRSKRAAPPHSEITVQPARSRKRTNGASKGVDPRLSAALELIEERRAVLLEELRGLEGSANALATLADQPLPYPELS